MARKKRGLLGHGLAFDVAAGLFGGGFDPNADTRLRLWYDFSDDSTRYQDTGFTTLSGDTDPLGGLLDKSSYERNATQGTTANKPTSQTNIKNGRAIGRFATDDYLEFTPFDFTTCSVFVVVELDSNHNGRYLSLVASGENEDFDNADSMAVAGRQIVKIDTDLNIIYTANTVWNIIQHEFANGNAKVVRNGTTVGTDTYTNQTEVNPDTGRIGAGWNVGALSDFMNGDYGELRFYAPKLTDSETQQVINHLSAKWAISWS